LLNKYSSIVVVLVYFVIIFLEIVKSEGMVKILDIGNKYRNRLVYVLNMNELLNALANFIITPGFRWFMLALSVIINFIRYLNEPQRFSTYKAGFGLTYRWHLYIIALIAFISYTFTAMSLWINIPFNEYIPLPEHWYIYLFIICVAIITQITIDSPEIIDDGSFNPPPAYMLPDSYRVMLAFASLVVNIVVMLQMYIYFGIADLSKKTRLSRYFLERFGGWYPGNKLDYIYEWSGLIDIGISIYILYLQSNFQACEYGLPSSWNF